MRAFASDNYAPILPEALDAIAAVNHGHAVSYGADETTARLQTVVRAHFGEDATAFPVFNGTGANVVGLRAMLRPWQGVDLRRERAPQRRRGRRARGDGRDQAADRPDARRQAHARARRRAGSCGSATSTSSSPGSSRSRSRPSSARSTRSRSCARWASTPTRTGCCSTSTARGWPTPPPSLDVRAAGDHDRRRRRRRLARRHEDRAARGRGRDRPATRSSPRRCCTCASSRCSWRRRCASSRAQLLALLRGRPVAPRGRARQRDGGAAGRRRRRRADDHAGRPGQRASSRSSRPARPSSCSSDFKFYVWDEHTGEVRWMCSWDTTEEDVDAFVEAILGVVRAPSAECRPPTPPDTTRRSA